MHFQLTLFCTSTFSFASSWEVVKNPQPSRTRLDTSGLLVTADLLVGHSFKKNIRGGPQPRHVLPGSNPPYARTKQRLNLQGPFFPFLFGLGLTLPLINNNQPEKSPKPHHQQQVVLPPSLPPPTLHYTLFRRLPTFFVSLTRHHHHYRDFCAAEEWEYCVLSEKKRKEQKKTFGALAIFSHAVYCRDPGKESTLLKGAPSRWSPTTCSRSRNSMWRDLCRIWW